MTEDRGVPTARRDALADEFRYFLENQDDLVKRFNGKVLVIKGAEVVGAYASVIEAVDETSKEHRLGTFLVQRCEPGNQCYTAMFHGYRVKHAVPGV